MNHFSSIKLPDLSPFHLQHWRNRLSNFRGVHPVVFESDDWGLCGEGRNAQVYSDLISIGYTDIVSEKLQPMYKNTLESETDLENLCNSLVKYKDSLGRFPVITANMIMSNPDFDRIKMNKFSNYFVIPITKGFPSGWGDWSTVVRGWKKAIRRKVWVPEYHGFSHFNYRNWMRGLRNKDSRLLDFFDKRLVTSSDEFRVLSEYGVHLGDAWVFQSYKEQFSDICNGLEIFNTLFRRYPRTTIPPNNVWNSSTYRAFSKANVRFIQSEKESTKSTIGVRNMDLSTISDVITSLLLQFGPLRKHHRNVRLEYTAVDESEAVTSTEQLFKSSVPAIVDTHRVNYVSGVDASLPQKSLRRLESYLRAILEDDKIVFLTDNELFQICSTGVSYEIFGEER